jgi:Xaa-Pro dipeptidase
MKDRTAELYPAHVDELKRRHDQALETTGYDRVVIYGGAEHITFLDDNVYPFKPNPHFKSWVPVIDNPNCFVIYEPGRKPELFFFQPDDYWYKPAEDPAGFWTASFDISILRQLSDARPLLTSGGRTAFIGEGDGFGEWGFAAINPEPLVTELHFARAWKTDYEIECMRLANECGARGHREAEAAFREGASEYEIHLRYLRATGQREAELPYGNIIALNRNGAVLHYQHTERKARPRRDLRSFLIDAGASVNGYASDITRTYSASDPDFDRMIAALDSRQQELCTMVRPGVDYREIHLAAHLKMSEVLEEFGIIRCSASSAVEKGISRAFFPHGVGHFIGLQVHDVAGFMANASGRTIERPEGHPHLRLTRVVEPRQVFTIEPGIYFIDSLLEELKKSSSAAEVDWAVVERYHPFGGIRIEDDVVVTATVPENLTRNAFEAVGQPAAIGA